MAIIMLQDGDKTWFPVLLNFFEYKAIFISHF